MAQRAKYIPSFTLPTSLAGQKFSPAQLSAAFNEIAFRHCYWWHCEALPAQAFKRRGGDVSGENRQSGAFCIHLYKRILKT